MHSKYLEMRKFLFQFGPLWPLMRYDNNDKCIYKLSKNQLEKLEAARSAYLWLPLVTYPYLWFYLSLP